MTDVVRAEYERRAGGGSGHQAAGTRVLFCPVTGHAVVNHGVLDSDVNFSPSPSAVETLGRKIREVLSLIGFASCRQY